MAVAAKAIFHISSFLTIACAVAIICIIALELTDASISWNGYTNGTCLLGNDPDGGTLCYYLYAVAGISLIASCTLSILQCCTCNCCGLGDFLDWILGIAGVIWWAIAGGVTTNGVNDANNSGLPEEGWRNTVLVLVWVEVALFGLVILTGIARACCCR